MPGLRYDLQYVGSYTHGWSSLSSSAVATSRAMFELLQIPKRRTALLFSTSDWGVWSVCWLTHIIPLCPVHILTVVPRSRNAYGAALQIAPATQAALMKEQASTGKVWQGRSA